MPLPKRRHSRARRDKGRAHMRLAGPALVACSQCHSLKLPHRVCPACGYYDGKKVVEIKEKKEEKASKK